MIRDATVLWWPHPGCRYRGNSIPVKTANDCPVAPRRVGACRQRANQDGSGGRPTAR
eukprot:XP_001709464.1 Hypothetical protein GL50803_116179 [Giardia lamblia ATCC 50803]